MTAHTTAASRHRRWLPALALAWAGTALAQYADDDRTDWREDPAPPPPAYTTEASQLISIDMPSGTSVQVAIDPATLALNRTTGVARYVVVARGVSAVNASYEGIRCATSEYKVYARRTEGQPWAPVSAPQWKPMFGQSGIVTSYPARLARDGLCMGLTMRQ
ncbi:MAG: CNP1-like family protein, partial [Burkholderiaceae bacterium]|nr:CNP1-like family protein [Burkholderiaceae bacterium]